MLFAPKEMQDSKAESQHGKQQEPDFRQRLHEIAMRDPLTTDQLQTDRDLDLLMFEGFITGTLDAKNPNNLKVLDHLHNRMDREEERRASKSKEL